MSVLYPAKPVLYPANRVLYPVKSVLYTYALTRNPLSCKGFRQLSTSKAFETPKTKRNLPAKAER